MYIGLYNAHVDYPHSINNVWENNMPRKKIKIEIPEKTLAERCTELARVINDNRYEFDDYGDDLGYTVEETEL